MGFFDNLLRVVGGHGGGHSNDFDLRDGEISECPFCGWEGDSMEITADFGCPECPDDYTGPKYCCGGIYEQGEDTCASCGEPL